MKRIAFFSSLLFAFPFILFAKDIDLIFIGISQGSAPAFEETLDRRIRENLSTLQEMHITDYLQTQSFRRKIRFDESPTVSRKLVESLKQYSSDSAVFVWGRIKNYMVAGKRMKVIRGFIRGEIVLTLNVYSLRYKNYAFSGDVQTSLEKPKGFIFFGNAEKEIIVSPSERKEMTDKLLDQAARKSASLIATIIQSERLHAAKEAENAGAKSYEAPSVSDMFDVPSVEAASVDKDRKKSSAVSDTLLSKEQANPQSSDTLSSNNQTTPATPDTISSKMQTTPATQDAIPSKMQTTPTTQDTISSEMQSEPPAESTTESETSDSSPLIDTVGVQEKE